MNVRSDILPGLVDVVDSLACQFIQPNKPFSKQGVFDHVRPLIPDSTGITPAMLDGIVWDVIDGITENALRSIADLAQ
jgi:hypothetical protein